MAGGASAQTPAAAPAAPPPTDWTDTIKKPTDWLNLGADLRLRHESLINHFALNDDADNEWSFERARARVWADIVPVKEFDAFARMTWEGRHWWLPDTRDEWPGANIVFDNLFLRLNNIGEVATLTVGRQDIIFGDGWLVLEGTPLDGSRTIYFDAARLNLNLKDAKTSVDLVYIDQHANPNRWLHPIGGAQRPEFQIEQDEVGAIAYVTNKSLTDTTLEPYFMYKRNDAILANGDNGEIYTAGARILHNFDPNWIGQIEGAYQFGRRNGADLSAGGVNSRLTYLFKDAWKNQLRLSYQFLSGDDPDTAQNEAFVPLWARWPQWSELLVYTYATETRIAEVTNLHRAALGWQGEPTRQIKLSAEYSLLFADQNTLRASPGFSRAGAFRGQLFQGIFRYTFNRHLSGHLWGEYFIPGNYFSDDRRDNATFFRAEIVVAL